MFGLAWPELLLIGAVAIVAIGPKDLPVAMRKLGAFARKARLTMAEFQKHWDDLPDNTGVTDVQKKIDAMQQDGFKKFKVDGASLDERTKAAYGDDEKP